MSADFSPATQDRLQGAAAMLLLVMILLPIWALQHPAPWSPLGMAQPQASAPAPAAPQDPHPRIFNPDAHLDTSRVNNR